MNGSSIDSSARVLFVPYPQHDPGTVARRGGPVCAVARAVATLVSQLRARLQARFAAADAGMSTAEYAVGTVVILGDQKL